MINSAALQSFVDDELNRAPMLAQKVIDDTLMVLSNMPMSASPAERFQAVDLAMTLRPQRQRVATTYVDSLRHHVKRQMSGDPAPWAEAAPLTGGRFGAASLQLVDETKVSSDVLISQCITQIKSIAEFELRELTTFTSALLGDMQVTTDHNPFKAEVQARAFWAAAQVLPEAGGLRTVFMKYGSAPFAQELRRSYASACSRLEDAGIQPAAYGTVVVPSGTKIPGKASGWTDNDAQLRAVSQSAGTRAGAGGAGAGFMPANTAPADLPADPEYLGLLSRLFDIILSDRRLAADVKAVLSRLQAPATRLARSDHSLLDTHDHAMWLLLDRIAWQDEVLPAAPHPARLAVMQMVGSLAAQLSNTAAQNTGLYEWALDNLMASERQRFDQRRQRLAPLISELEALALRSTQPSQLAGAPMSALDTGQMDTVPSQLLDLPSTSDSKTLDKRWITALRPGHVARMYMAGQWVHAQLVWVDTQQEVFLWADCRSDAAWPIKRSALTLLQTEALAAAHEPRSLVRAAARLVASQITRSR